MALLVFMTRLEGFDIYLKVAQWYTVMAKSIGAVKAGLYVPSLNKRLYIRRVTGHYSARTQHSEQSSLSSNFYVPKHLPRS